MKKILSSFTMFPKLAIALLIITGPFTGWGQVSLTGSTYTQNFDSYNGNSGGEPTGWSVSCPNYRGQGNGSSNTGGAWAYGASGDWSLGYLGSGTSASYTGTVDFTNNTGATIKTLIISYNFEQWRVGGGNTLGFTFTGTGDLASVSGVSGLDQTSSNSGTTGTCQTTAKTITLTGLSIATSSTFGLKFTSADGTGNDNGKSVDDFSICIPPDISSQSTSAQTVCTGSAFSAISVSVSGSGLSYQWYSNTTASTVGGTSLGSANGAQTDTYTPQSSSLGVKYYYVVVTNGTCATTSAVSGAMTVIAPPVINSITAPTQTVCQNVALSSMSVSATGTGLTYQWYSNTTASNTGGTSMGTTNGAQTATFTPPSSTAGTLYYYVGVGNGTCVVKSSPSGAIVVNGSPNVVSQSTTTQSVCLNGTFSPLKVTATGAGLSYQWYSNTTASYTGATSLGSSNGAQTDTYSPQSTSSGKKFYFAIVSGTCSPTDSSNLSDSMVVGTAPIVVSQSTTTQTVCAGTAFSPLTVTATGAGLTYQWYSNTTASYNGATSMGTTNGAKTPSFTPLSNTAGTLYYFAIVSGACSPTDSSNISDSMVVRALPAISAQSTGAQTVCQGAAFSPLTVTATGAGITYQWYSNTTASTTGGTSLGSASGAQTASYTPSNATVGTLYYYVIVSGTCTPPVTSTVSGAMIVNALPNITAQSTATQSVCKGAAFNPLTVTATGTGITYQWYSNTTASYTGATSLGSTNGAQTASYTPPSSVAGKLYYFAIVSGACAPTDSSNLSDSIIVNALPAISAQSTTAQTVCQGTAINPLTVTATGAGIKYQWYSNTTASTIGGTSLGAANGAQTATYTPANATPGTLYYYVVVSGTCIPSVTSAVSGAIVVNAVPNISTQTTAAQTVCKGTKLNTLTVSATGTGITYQWYSNTTASAVGGTSLGTNRGAQTAGFSPDSSIAGTLYYYVVVSGTCNPADTSNVSGAIIVNTPPAITTQSTAAQTTCTGTAFAPLTVTATGSGLTYQWYSNTTASTTGGTSLGSANGAQTATYTPANTTAGTLYYYVVVSGSCPSPVTSAVSGAMLVNETPSITTPPSALAQTITIGGTITPLSVTATGTNITYQWYSNTTASTTGGTLITGATAATYTPQNTTPGILYYYVVVSGTCNPAATSAVSGAITVKSPISIVVSNTNQPQFTTQTLNRNKTVVPVSRFQVNVTGGTAILSGLSFTTPGVGATCNYVKTDITNFKLFYTTTTAFNTNTPVTGATIQASAKTTATAAETITFTGLTQTLPAGTYYFWVTADILPLATISRTITVNAPVLTASEGTVSGATVATGTQTIVSGVGIEEVNAASIFVGSYGNEVKITANTTETLTAEITDLLGRTLAIAPVEGNGLTNSITLSGVATGYYIVRVSGANTLHTAKVYIQ